MRVLRGLSGRVLACGCVVGVYETYRGAVVDSIDVRSDGCPNPDHRRGAIVPPAFDEAPNVGGVARRADDRRS